MAMIFADIRGVKNYIRDIELDKNLTNKQIKYFKNVSGYHIQQACEKMIKLQIYNSGVAIDYSKLYKHNLQQIVSYAEEKGIALTIPKYVRDNMDLLTSWEADGRYSVTKVVRLDRVKSMYDVVEEWYKQLSELGYK